MPKHFGILLYPGFEALDAFGPLEVVNGLSASHEITLSVIAETLDPVSTQMKGMHSVGQSVNPTSTFADVSSLDVLIIPGGFGGFEPTTELLDFLRKIIPATKNVITVCNGSALLAMTGLLDGKKATTNKALWEKCTGFGPKVNWVAKARWVEDGKFWTSSGVSAGIDAVLAWTASVYGEETAAYMANGMEFKRTETSLGDPFSEIFKCDDVPAKAEA